MATANTNTLEIGTLRLRAIKNPVDLTVRIRVEQDDNGYQEIKRWITLRSSSLSFVGSDDTESTNLEYSCISKLSGVLRSVCLIGVDDIFIIILSVSLLRIFNIILTYMIQNCITFVNIRCVFRFL